MKATTISKFVLISFIVLSTSAFADDWKTGPYAGVVLGAGNPTTTLEDQPSYFNYTSIQTTKFGATVGATGGYNYILEKNVLIGLESDFSGTSFKGTNLPFGNSNGFIKAKWDDLVTIRGRAGILAGNALIYVTGGFAGANVKASAGYYLPNWSLSFPSFHPGIVAGAGFEYKLHYSPLSIKGEALYLSLSQENGSLPGTKLTPSGSIVRLGLNYNF